MGSVPRSLLRETKWFKNAPAACCGVTYFKEHFIFSLAALK
jgi:hypothetical protein